MSDGARQCGARLPSRRALPRGLLAATLLAMSMGCRKNRPSALASSDASPPSNAAVVVEEAPRTPWSELVRRGKFAEAAQAVDALPDGERAHDDLRYLRARLALELGDGALALRQLEGLESAFPLLAQDVQERRADAYFAAGRFKEAAEFYATRPSAAFQLKASRAFERALDAVRARAATDRIAADPRATRAQEAEARARRMRLGGQNAREQAEDVRWLGIEAPDLPESEGNEPHFATLAETRPLTPAESNKRARLLGDAGKIDEAIKTLDDMIEPKTQAGRVDRLRAKAEIYYRSRTHPQLAARTFDEIVKLVGATALEETFKAARALSRADHDDEAIERFLGLARRAPKSPFGEEALFLAGRLHLLHGRFGQAATLLDEHHDKHANARKEAARVRALAHLMAGHYAQAIRLFEEISEDEREPLAAARARTMAALAALKSGDRTLAVARYSEVARSRPLSWPALVARAHLLELKAPIPPAFDAAVEPPPPAGESLTVVLPPPVDLLHRLGLEDDAEDALRDREAAVIAAAPGRSTEALCIAYGKLGRGKRQYQLAQQIPQALLFSLPTSRTRWSWDCAYPTPFDEVVKDEESRAHLPAGTVHAVMRQESGFDPDALSPARAVGLLQLLPETARTVATTSGALSSSGDAGTNLEALRLTDPNLNVKLGALYLHELVEKFHGELALALAGYNGGPDNVAKWLGRLRGLPVDVFVEHIPYAETRAYVVRIMGNFARYAYLRGGEAAVPALSLAPIDPSPRDQ